MTIWRRLSKQVSDLFGPVAARERVDPPRPRRGPQTHVIILDGTMSTLMPGCETNAGLTCKLLSEVQGISVFYEAGIQLLDWRRAPDVMLGRGINRQIRRAYGWLASRYRPGDMIFLLGYSRGAFAVRSLAGVIDQVGLLRPDCATERNIRTAYRHYQALPGSDIARDFRRVHCHDEVAIEMIGVWDTVKALGVRLPVLWKWSEPAHAFHSHQLGASIRHGFHALALDETREVFAPVLWDCPPDWTGSVEQVWFNGAHGDVGGQLGGFHAARPLANIPLVWMLEKAEGCGLPLPAGWRERFPCDPGAPRVGTWRGWARMFLLRRARIVGQDRSERLHHTVRTVPRHAAQLDEAVRA
jgi:uncharacterized protein (DUF2235 family)